MPLRSVEPYNKLPIEKIEKLQEIAVVKTLLEGSLLISEGSSTTDFFIILEGRCRVTLKDIELAVRGPGDLIGTVSNLMRTTRTATVIALEDVKILTFDGSKFSAFLEILPEDFVNNIHSTVADMLESVLTHLPIFEGVPSASLNSLASLFHFEVFKTGDLVIKEGNVGDKFFIIMHGNAKVTKLVDGEEKYLDTRKAGEWFGGIALIKKTLRTASVTAENDLTCLVLAEKHFDAFLSQLPPALQKTIRDMAAQRTISTIKLIPFFSKFAQDKLELLISLFHFRVVTTGEKILEEGSPAKFVLVIRGIVAMTKLGKDGLVRSAGTFEQNEFFGEECLMKVGVTQSANAVGVTTCSLLILEPEAFLRYTSSFPDSDEVRMAINHHKMRKNLMGVKRNFNSSISSETKVKKEKSGSFA